jgi:glycosyltransferase involved in cell wall biosynthesis
MNIGFDAKRAFHNNTGLGNYSRTLITGLAEYFPEHQYYLFNPKASGHFSTPNFTYVHEVQPSAWISKKLSSAWRSSWIKKDLKKYGIELYHGLSHEIPVGIQQSGIRSVVTIHDLIFERYPEQYAKIDVQIYRKKFRYACAYADKIIAISEQTKKDLIEIYQVDPAKIEICYQSCDPVFGSVVPDVLKISLRQKFALPSQFFLSVGSIIERKNLLNICKALLHFKDLPLVVIGEGKEYKQKVQSFLFQHGLENRVMFLSENANARTEFRSPEILAAIYQMSSGMIYPSFFEGFGIPVLEALWSKVPVITSNVSCMPETGGSGAYYVDPSSPESIAAAMKEVYHNSSLRYRMVEKGFEHAQNFTLEKCATSVMNVFKKVMHAP